MEKLHLISDSIFKELGFNSPKKYNQPSKEATAPPNTVIMLLRRPFQSPCAIESAYKIKLVGSLKFINF